MIENNAMNYYRKNQNCFRIESYQGIYDHVTNSASNCSKNFENKERLGNIYILPTTHIGSRRYMQQHYQDEKAIMRQFRRPDFFITMTCNPKWKELKRVLKKFPKGSTPNDIPNITVRLFYLKFMSLLKDITKNNIFGKHISYIYTIKSQKRGLPHTHILLTLHPDNKLMTAENIDHYISSEIPLKDLVLQKLVKKHMLHGPHDKNSPCKSDDSILSTNVKNIFQNLSKTVQFSKKMVILYTVDVITFPITIFIQKKSL